MPSFFGEYYSALAKTCKKNWLCSRRLLASTVIFNELCVWAKLYLQYSWRQMIKQWPKQKWSYNTVHQFWKYYLPRHETWDRNIPQWHCLLGLNWTKAALKMFVCIYVAMHKWQKQVARWHYDIQKWRPCGSCK